MHINDPSKSIRDNRRDLTDYVIHLTRRRDDKSPFDVLKSILQQGFLNPTFAKADGGGIGVKGPFPAVCFTEQPISAIVETLRDCQFRYSGYGIAFHKTAIFEHGARPVIYGDTKVIGRKIGKEQNGWEEGKEVYDGGLSRELQYLWVKYDPVGDVNGIWSTLDFTWEREWRMKIEQLSVDGGLPVGINSTYHLHKGVILVEKESEVVEIKAVVEARRQRGATWPEHVDKVVSIETARKKLGEDDVRYARLETWPDD